MGQFITEHNEKMMKKAEIIKERVCSSSSKAAEQLKQKWKF
jgi:hypothetical protein